MIILFAAIFLVIAVLLGIFITGAGVSARTHVRVGLRAIAVSYFLGILLLFAALIWFS